MAHKLKKRNKTIYPNLEINDVNGAVVMHATIFSGGKK
ncbi:MAG: hypothetical protein PWP15_1606 [Methanothermococcus sp.]|jgi:hypothetical protein|nr:hypothetical protein [Methanothermococcus sp.]MDK2988245.1 hypothetical protein [Methanothermococcus sp.]